MNWKVLDALDTKYSAINAIMVVELSSRHVVMSNALAVEYFAGRDDIISLQRMLGRDTDLVDFFEMVQQTLDVEHIAVVDDVMAEGKTGDDLDCRITFTYATPSKKFLFMKLHPVVNNRPYYLEKFIETRKRPCFTLSLNENLSVNHGNPMFYKAFACNKTSMKLRYKNYFGNLLSEEFRQDYEAMIYQAVEEKPYGRLEIPVQTALGEALWFYYDTTRLRQVESDFRNNLFCLLVQKNATHEQLSNPFDPADGG